MTYEFETEVANGLPKCRMLLGGDWVEGAGASQDILDKFHLKPFAQLPACTEAQIQKMIDLGVAAFGADRLSPHDRGAILDRVAGLLQERAEECREVMQAETGFTVSDCRNEIGRTIQTLRLTAEEARRFAGDVLPVAGAAGQAKRTAFTLRIPLGLVLAVTPFNAPLNTVTHKIAPALAAGNAVILKPAGQTPRTACFISSLFLEAGLPSGMLQVFHGGGAAVATAMKDQRVRYIAFTGSTGVGRKIQAQAELRRTQMELGSIAFTVLAADADLDLALPKVVGAGYRKAGQVCTSVQILLVQESLKAEVERRMGALVGALKYGDPSEDDCTTGPLISLADAERVEAWVNEAVAGGATCLAGGTRSGAVVAPTLLSGVSRAMKVGCEEIFGPVICIESFDAFPEALERVNDTPYGLATGLFTNRLDDAFLAARQLQVGGVHVNETSSSRWDSMPYGGSKDSGFGREGPHYAMQEMSEERVVSFSI
ncbi:aldehyde dehydrogenase family protein [Lentibacter algarum]|uniref:aldehyde dehydrogenase family protein n=1 Tax=Lentibacter algarum TaxID=576131 RepID=UPI001C07A1BB|nr:aldehyde dehydrogenase family protein [Lentibacter algarum]MBU2980209.1 aldehyde dehydrogenase family protein [Lentibacter algarum]